MKRPVISLIIIGMIIAAGIFALLYISASNQKIYGEVEEVLSSAGQELNEAVDSLNREAKDYARRLSFLADDGLLRRVEQLAEELRLYTDSPRELARLCHEIKGICRELMENELPKLGRIL